MEKNPLCSEIDKNHRKILFEENVGLFSAKPDCT
jgi:hypothetical protein